MLGYGSGGGGGRRRWLERVVAGRGAPRQVLIPARPTRQVCGGVRCEMMRGYAPSVLATALIYDVTWGDQGLGFIYILSGERKTDRRISCYIVNL